MLYNDFQGTLDHLRAVFGIGGAQVRIETDEQTYPRGSPVRGRVVLEGGQVEQRVQAVDLRMYEIEPKSNSEGPGESQARIEILATDLTIAPQEQHIFPFVMSLPEDAILTIDGALGLQYGGVRLRAQAYIPWAADPTASVVLRVEVQPEVLAVYEAARALGFVPVAGLRPCAQGRGTIKDYAVIEQHWMPPLAGVSLELAVEGRYVLGVLRVTYSHLRLADRPGSEFRIPRTDLLAADGTKQPSAAVPSLERALREVTENTLLRPASAPAADASRLLRPAGAASTPPEHLLRPADFNPSNGDSKPEEP